MEDSLLRLNANRCATGGGGGEHIFIFILNLYLLSLCFFFSTLQRPPSFRVIEIVARNGFPETSPPKKSKTSSKGLLHPLKEHPPVKSISTTSRLSHRRVRRQGGAAVPSCAAQGGGFVPVWPGLAVSPSLGFVPAPPCAGIHSASGRRFIAQPGRLR